MSEKGFVIGAHWSACGFIGSSRWLVTRVACPVMCVSSELDTVLAVWEDSVPDVTKKKPTVPWDSVVFMYLYGFSDAPSVPMRFFHYE